MAWPEDPISYEELLGQCGVDAHERLLGGVKAGSEDPDSPPMVLSARCAARLARGAADAVGSGDLDLMDGGRIGGVQLYDPHKITYRVHEKLDAMIEEWKADGKLEPQPQPSERRYSVHVCARIGRRSAMEDKHLLLPDLNGFCNLASETPQAFFGVFDGHGGKEGAQFAQNQLVSFYTQHEAFESDISTALVEGTLAADKSFLEKSDRDGLSCGCTSLAVVVRGRKLHVAWLGDSQVMLCREGKPVQLMDPHKPEREDEKARIQADGGDVVFHGAWRVNGVLSVARAIGDKKLKKWVIGKPDVATHDLDDKCEFLVLACDGLWDVMSQEEVVAFVLDHRSKTGSDEKVADALAAHCIETLESTDNVTCAVVFLQPGLLDAVDGE